MLLFTVKVRQNRAVKSQASSEPKEITEKMTELVIDVPEISKSRVKKINFNYMKLTNFLFGHMLILGCICAYFVRLVPVTC